MKYDRLAPKEVEDFGWLRFRDGSKGRPLEDYERDMMWDLQHSIGKCIQDAWLVRDILVESSLLKHLYDSGSTCGYTKDELIGVAKAYLYVFIPMLNIRVPDSVKKDLEYLKNKSSRRG